MQYKDLKQCDNEIDKECKSSLLWHFFLHSDVCTTKACLVKAYTASDVFMPIELERINGYYFEITMFPSNMVDMS